MTGSIPGEFRIGRLSPVATLVCDAQHENIDFGRQHAGQTRACPASIATTALNNAVLRTFSVALPAFVDGQRFCSAPHRIRRWEKPPRPYTWEIWASETK